MSKCYHGFSRTNELLFELADLVEWSLDRWARRNEISKKLPDHDSKGRAVGKKGWDLAYCRARKQGLIEDRIRGKNLELRLTDEGRKRLLVSKIHSVQERYKKDWLCVVTFDFPEKEKTSRNIFRAFIKECGFKQFQKSVWVCDRRVEKHLLEFVNRMDIRPWVQVMEAKIL